MRDTLRSALGRALLPDASLGHPGPLQLQSAQSNDDLFPRFRAELTALGGIVHEAAAFRDVLGIIQEVVVAQPIAKVLMWDDAALPVQGLGAAMIALGMTVTTHTRDDMASVESRTELASCIVGVTGADAGLAETGSVVLVSGPGRGRLTSLLPKVHIALLRRRDIVPSLATLLRERADLVTSGSNFLCITGPSRTADIEHTLSRGVHGPGEVHVIVVGGED
ncbi:MAG: lactate utilization protein [Vicinamibacterales bacterium]